MKLGKFKKRRIRLLWHGEFGFTTGFAGVSENILDRLVSCTTDIGTQKFEPAVMALGQGMNPFEEKHKKPYPVIPMYGDRRSAPYGQDYAQDLVRRFKPDIVLTFGDTWMTEWWNDPNRIPADLRKTFKLVAYTAIDGYPIPKEWVNKYKDFDKIICFTKFGKDAVEERAKQMGVKLNVSFIHHGVNPQVFKPLPQKDVLAFKAQRGLENKKIIGMFSRNQPRKHHPEFVEFAAKMLEKHDNDPDLMFYLHCVERDAGWDLNALMDDINDLKLRERFEKFGVIEPGQEIPESKYDDLHKRFIFPGIKNPAKGMPVELLNMMYNICDVHLLLTSGEGFGCTLIESMSAGVPTLTNDYAAGAELVKEADSGGVIKARDYTYRGSDNNFPRPHTDYNDAIEKVTALLEDEELHKKHSKRARAFAMGMTWDNINYDWDRELSEVYELDPSIPQKAEVI